MTYQMPLSHEEIAARLSMPKTPEGYIVSLVWIPRHLPYFQSYEVAWREWLGKHPRHLWPDWVEQYAHSVKTARQGEEA